MTRSQLVEILAQRLHLEPRAADAVVRSIFEAMRQALRHGRGIELRGFGTFSVRTHGAYHGRNPQSGERVEVPGKMVPAFKVGKPMRARLATTAVGSSARRPPARPRDTQATGTATARRPLAAREGGE